MLGSWLGRWLTRAQAPPDPHPERRLFHLYTRALGAAYLAVSAGLAGFFLFELKQDLLTEADLIQEQVQRHGQALDAVIQTSVDQLETLRTTLGLELADRACLDGRRQAASGPVKQTGSHFTWEAVVGGVVAAHLEGDGPLLARADEFYCDLGAVLALAVQAQAMTLHASTVGRAHFLSVHDFSFHTPGQPPMVRRAGRLSAAHAEVWRQGQPAANPDRRKVWGAAYFGGADLGLLVPLAAPAYDGRRFMGVVIVDVRLDALSRIHAAMGYLSGSAALVDASGRVLSHPALASEAHRARAPASLEHTFASPALSSPEALARIPEGKAVERAGWIVIRHPLRAAPWQLVYAVPRPALWQALLLQRGPALGTALLVLGVLMALIHGAVWRGFVAPAAHLAGHALAASTLEPRAVPRVPHAWRPWFDSITRVFRESMHLGNLRREVDIAARLQQSILPRQWPQDPRFDLWGTMRPAKDIGGDFYDHFALARGRHGLVVADVSGKGISAGLFGTLSKTLLRAIATQQGDSPGAVIRAVNDGLCPDNESSMFVTTFYGQYDPANGRFVYANAGHPAPLLITAQGDVQWLSGPGGPALGVVPGLGFREGTVNLAPGDTVLVFTDGVTESVNGDGQEFGATRLSALFEGGPAASAREAVQRMLEQVERHAKGVEPYDDITCMGLHCRGLGPEPVTVPAGSPV